MKKSIKILGLACMAGMLAFMSSCKKNDTTSSIRVAIPSLDTEGVERAYLDNKAYVRWQGGDALYVYNVNPDDASKTIVAYYVADESCEGSTVGLFTTNATTLGALQGPCYSAIYPGYWKGDYAQYDSPVDNSTINVDNRVVFATQPTQRYYQVEFGGSPNMSTIDPDALRLVWGEPDFDHGMSMSHIFGVVKLQIVGDPGDQVNRIELIDNTQDACLCGTVSLNVGALEKQTLLDLKQAMKDYRASGNPADIAGMRDILVEDFGYLPEDRLGNMLTLDCSLDQPELDYNDAEFFYFGVRPGAFAGGMTVNVYLVGESEPRVITNPIVVGNQYPLNYFSVPGAMRTYQIDLSTK